MQYSCKNFQLYMYIKMYCTRSCKPSRGGLAGKCTKVVGGGLHEGGWLYYIFLYFERGGGLREILPTGPYWGSLTRASTVYSARHQGFTRFSTAFFKFFTRARSLVSIGHDCAQMHVAFPSSIAHSCPIAHFFSKHAKKYTAHKKSVIEKSIFLRRINPTTLLS